MIKPRSYALGNNIWLNSKYIKSILNLKLRITFFRPFQVPYPMGSQAYKLEFSKMWKIYDVFYISLLK